MEVTANVELVAVEGKKLVFSVRAHDGADLISEGKHERYVITNQVTTPDRAAIGDTIERGIYRDSTDRNMTRRCTPFDQFGADVIVGDSERRHLRFHPD